MKHVARYLTLGLLLAIGPGCGKATQVATDKATEAAIESAAKQDGQDVNVKVDSSKGTFQMTQTTDGGKTTAAYGEGTKLPADWPKDVPVYEGISLLMAQCTPADGVFMISGEVPATLDKVITFYKEKSKALGWTVANTMSVPNQTDTTIYKSNDRDINITANVEGGKTMIVISVSKS